MKITIDVPADLEQDLAQEAEKLGLLLPEYVLRLISSGGFHGASPKTGPELVAYWEKEGLIGSRPEIKDPAKHAKSLREKAQKRRKD